MDENSQYLELFYEETEDHLQKMNDYVLTLEEDPHNKDILDEIFRSAHTLKGMAATMGFTDMAELTHRLENVFSVLKKPEAEADEESISLVFLSLDALSAMLEEIREGKPSQFNYEDIETLCDRIVARSEGKSKTLKEVGEKNEIMQAPFTTFMSTLEESDKKVAETAMENGYNAYAIAVRIQKESMMKNARVFLTLNNLEGLGEIIKTEPSIDVLENEEFGSVFKLLYLSPLERDEVQRRILASSEIEEVLLETLEESLAQVPTLTEEEVPASDDRKTENDGQAVAVSRTPSANQSIRVDLQKLDTFMNLISELVVYRNQLESISENSANNQLQDKLEQISRIISNLQSQVISIRMQPLKTVLSRFPRMVRDLSNELGKDIDYVVEGEDTELDRTVISELGEPLIHLLRNCCDHGIEDPSTRKAFGKTPKGTVRIAAYSEGNQVVISVSDDGKGLDPAALKSSAEKKGIDTTGMTDLQLQELIFHPGFSTAEKVTNVSGRGVGMDAVKTKITELNGSIEVWSEVGKGTTFRLSLPLTLSIIESLIVEIGYIEYAVPLSVVKKAVKCTPENTKRTHDGEVYIEDGHVMPVIRLSKMFNKDDTEVEDSYFIIVSVNGKEYALAVSSFTGQKEIVIKKLGKELGDDLPYLGAAIMGDGGVLLILDVSKTCMERTRVVNV